MVFKITTPKYFTRKDFRLSGIYFFMYKGKIVYIGKSVDLIFRIFTGDVIGRIKYDSVRIILCESDKLLEYEKRWIIRFRPKYNSIHLYKWVGSYITRKRRVPINLKK